MSILLIGCQNQLVQAIVETGTPTVVFLINGRPLSINYAAAHVPAILEGWYLGQEGGTAALYPRTRQPSHTAGDGIEGI